MMKNRITPEHESSSVGSSSVSFLGSFVRKASTVVPTSVSGLVVREAASLCESANSQLSFENSEVASATVIVQVGSENAATSFESTANSEVSSENQGGSSSHMVTTDHATRATKTRTIPSAGTNPSDVGGARKQYRKGDTVKYQNGKTAYTVRALLGCGAFGEVYLVWSEVQQKLRAMKCTKFGKMTLEERRARFQPMCEEAFIMMELRHHPNIISIRFVKVSGLEFLVIMDLIHGSRELSEAYQSGSIWDPCSIDPLDKRPPSLKTISQTTSLLSLLWLQLAHAMDHLHGKHIMVCVSCSFTLFIRFFHSLKMLSNLYDRCMLAL